MYASDFPDSGAEAPPRPAQRVQSSASDTSYDIKRTLSLRHAQLALPPPPPPFSLCPLRSTYGGGSALGAMARLHRSASGAQYVQAPAPVGKEAGGLVPGAPGGGSAETRQGQIGREGQRRVAGLRDGGAPDHHAEPVRRRPCSLRVSRGATRSHKPYRREGGGK